MKAGLETIWLQAARSRKNVSWLGALTIAALASGCLSAKNADPALTLSRSSNRPTFEDCASRATAAINRYVPLAREFPPGSAKRQLYIEIMEAEERQAQAGQLSSERRACGELMARLSKAKAAEIEGRGSLPVAIRETSRDEYP